MYRVLPSNAGMQIVIQPENGSVQFINIPDATDVVEYKPEMQFDDDGAPIMNTEEGELRVTDVDGNVIGIIALDATWTPTSTLPEPDAPTVIEWDWGSDQELPRMYKGNTEFFPNNENGGYLSVTGNGSETRINIPDLVDLIDIQGNSIEPGDIELDFDIYKTEQILAFLDPDGTVAAYFNLETGEVQVRYKTIFTREAPVGEGIPAGLWSEELGFNGVRPGGDWTDYVDFTGKVTRIWIEAEPTTPYTQQYFPIESGYARMTWVTVDDDNGNEIDISIAGHYDYGDENDASALRISSQGIYIGSLSEDPNINTPPNSSFTNEEIVTAMENSYAVTVTLYEWNDPPQAYRYTDENPQIGWSSSPLARDTHIATSKTPDGGRMYDLQNKWFDNLEDGLPQGPDVLLFSYRTLRILIQPSN
jgi:hypothetical protein